MITYNKVPFVVSGATTAFIWFKGKFECSLLPGDIIAFIFPEIDVFKLGASNLSHLILQWY